MAFLDTKEEMLKLILTEYGKRKLSEGKLNIKFYSFFDDEVDYQTLYSSGSL